MEHVIEMFKRRELCRLVSNAAERLEHAGGVLHDIVVQMACAVRSSLLPIGCTPTLVARLRGRTSVRALNAAPRPP
jgi:hypothetical protein